VYCSGVYETGCGRPDTPYWPLVRPTASGPKSRHRKIRGRPVLLLTITRNCALSNIFCSQCFPRGQWTILDGLSQKLPSRRPTKLLFIEIIVQNCPFLVTLRNLAVKRWTILWTIRKGLSRKYRLSWHCRQTHESRGLRRDHATCQTLLIEARR
jgi:hypothetical protein